MAIFNGLNNGAVSRLKKSWAVRIVVLSITFLSVCELVLSTFVCLLPSFRNCRTGQKRSTTNSQTSCRPLITSATTAKLSRSFATPASPLSRISVRLSRALSLIPPLPPRTTHTLSKLTHALSALLMRDITFAHENPSQVNSLWNFQKLEILGKQILDLRHFQKTPFQHLVEVCRFACMGTRDFLLTFWFQVDEVIHSYFRDLKVVTKVLLAPEFCFVTLTNLATSCLLETGRGIV